MHDFAKLETTTEKDLSDSSDAMGVLEQNMKSWQAQLKKEN
jgi:hypothetical protein